MMALMGAEGRYEDWVYLMMLEREWKRPLTEEDQYTKVFEGSRPSARASVVLTFWSYFETRIDRLVRHALRAMPAAIADDLLRRHGSVSARLERLHTILFGASYWSDLKELGYADVAELLANTRERRNQFVHGKPAAIDDELVTTLVSLLKREHEAWISVFNKRAAPYRLSTGAK
jgi:hypothetical protein